MLRKCGFAEMTWLFVHPSYRRTRLAATLNSPSGLKFLIGHFLFEEPLLRRWVPRFLMDGFLKLETVLKLSVFFSPSWTVFACPTSPLRLALRTGNDLIELNTPATDLAVVINERRANFFSVEGTGDRLTGKYSLPVTRSASQKTQISFAFWEPAFYPWGLLVLIFLVAIGLRVWLMAYQQCIETDGVAYAHMAREWVEEGSMTNPMFPPLYPALIGITSNVVADYEVAARLVSVVTGSLLIFPLFLLARRVYGVAVALATVSLAAFYPPLVEASTQVLTASTFTLVLNLFFLAALLALTGRKWFWSLTAGSLLGVGYLIRPEIITYLPYFVVVCLGSVVWGTKSGGKTTTAMNIGCFLGGAAVFILPYAMQVGGLTGKTKVTLLISQAVGQTHFTRAIDRVEAADEGVAPSSLPGALLADPLVFLKRWIMNLHLVQKYVLPQLFPPVMIALVVLGLTRFGGKWEEFFLLFSWVPYTILLFFYVDARFFVPLLPVALILAGRGVELVQAALSKRLWFVGPGVVGASVVIIAIMTPSHSRCGRYTDRIPT